MLSLRSQRTRSPWRFISVAALWLLLCFSLLSCGSSFERERQEPSPKVWDGRYAEHFELYGTQLVPEYDWVWFYAQGTQESLLNGDALSPAGAMGVMQIMPATWEEIEDRLGIYASPYNVKVNIYFGIYYMKRMIAFWKAPRRPIERLELAQASYNAGAGNILKAQRLCNDASVWEEIRECLSQITGHHANETWTYVKKIAAYYLGMRRQRDR